ncbi:MAG TPA: 5'/3'-nucleotidase SurE [Bacteroidales bacterium]|nr:5'/3'-nucleotidase SurE [Bacteroidales bacterium]
MMKNRLQLLLTNDDGLEAPGLRYLVQVAREFGDVTVVAPDKPMSGMGHAITVREPLRLEKVREFPGLVEYSCTGTPVDAVKLGQKVILGHHPDIVLSGINHGSNASVNVIYSGTMAAVIEACIDGIPAVGFSLLDYAYDADFSACGEWVRKVVAYVIDQGLKRGVCLNVNIPAVPAGNIKGIKVCRQADAYWEEQFEERQDPHRQMYYWLSGSFREVADGEDSDLWALANHYVSVVPVQYDLTAHAAIPLLKNMESVS